MKYLISCITFLFVINACTTRPVEPTRNSRLIIDSLFQQRVIVLQPEMDSACVIVQRELFTKVVDSIMSARKNEMNLLVE